MHFQSTRGGKYPKSRLFLPSRHTNDSSSSRSNPIPGDGRTGIWAGRLQPARPYIATDGVSIRSVAIAVGVRCLSHRCELDARGRETCAGVETGEKRRWGDDDKIPLWILDRRNECTRRSRSDKTRVRDTRRDETRAGNETRRARAMDRP